MQRRCPEAIERWFKCYADSLYTFIYYRAAMDADCAAELVQETFLAALRQIDRYDPQKGSMFVWLTWLSKNHITRALRAKGRQIPYEQVWRDIDAGLLQAFQKIATEPLPDEILQRQETAQLVQMTLVNIPANYKAVLRARYYHKKSVEQIANCLGISEGAVRTLLHRARKAFAEAFVRLDRSFNGSWPLEGGTDV